MKKIKFQNLGKKILKLDTYRRITLISICFVTSLRAIKGNSHKRGKFKTGGSCRTLIQDKKRVSVGAIQQLSHISKVEGHSLNQRMIPNLFLKTTLGSIIGVSEQVLNKRDSCGFPSHRHHQWTHTVPYWQKTITNYQDWSAKVKILWSCLQQVRRQLWKKKSSFKALLKETMEREGPS